MRWVIRFTLINTGIVAAVLLLIGAAVGFSTLGFEGHEIVMVVIGVLVTTIVGSLLMGLVFVSDRSGQDEIVFGHELEQAPPVAERRNGTRSEGP